MGVFESSLSIVVPAREGFKSELFDSEKEIFGQNQKFLTATRKLELLLQDKVSKFRKTIKI